MDALAEFCRHVVGTRYEDLPERACPDNLVHQAGAYAGRLTREVIDQLTKSSPLHDLGKVGIPTGLLERSGESPARESSVGATSSRLTGVSTTVPPSRSPGSRSNKGTRSNSSNSVLP